MNGIDKLVAELCPDGVEHKTLSDVGEFIRGTGLQKKDLFDHDGVPAIHYGQIHTTYDVSTSKTISFTSPDIAARLRHACPGDLLIATTSEDDEAVAKATAWLGDTKVAISGDAFIYRHQLEPRYVSYFFQSQHFQSQKQRYISGAKVRRISGASLAKILIPVPPLKIQLEIANILDTFSALEAVLEAELEARTQQYEHYQRRLLTFTNHEIRWLTLGDIGRVAMCKRIFKNETTASGDVPFFKIGTFGREPDAFITEDKYNEYKELYAFPKPGDVLISAAGTIGRTIVYDGEPAYFQDSNIVWLEHDESVVMNSYLRHWYQIITWSTDGGTIKRLYNKNILRAKVAVPPLEEQQRIADILDKFDALVNDLSIGLPAEIEARRQQYEYYRDKLFTFKELEAAS